jgi:hypothetical protein
MLWKSLVCLDCPKIKLPSWEVCGSKPNNWTLDFIKILTQIQNKISKVQQKKNFKQFMLK